LLRFGTVSGHKADIRQTEGVNRAGAISSVSEDELALYLREHYWRNVLRAALFTYPRYLSRSHFERNGKAVPIVQVFNNALWTP